MKHILFDHHILYHQRVAWHNDHHHHGRPRLSNRGKAPLPCLQRRGHDRDLDRHHEQREGNGDVFYSVGLKEEARRGASLVLCRYLRHADEDEKRQKGEDFLFHKDIYSMMRTPPLSALATDCAYALNALLT